MRNRCIRRTAALRTATLRYAAPRNTALRTATQRAPQRTMNLNYCYAPPRPSALRNATHRTAPIKLEVKMYQINQLTQDQLRTLRNYLSDKSPGDTMEYSDIETETNIVMDTRGKELFRRAAKKENVELLVKRSVGWQIMDPKTCITALGARSMSIDNSVRRGETTYERSLGFFNELSTDEQGVVARIGSAFAQIRLAANEARRVKRELKRLQPLANSTVPATTK